jgi:WbqC-like protein family
MTLRVAIMQPYFMPYAGYFRLFAATDLFVIYDCVQFPRRGWVHRNQLTTASGQSDWLTLRLQKAPQDVRIKDLAFAPDAAEHMAADIRRFPALHNHSDHPLVQALSETNGAPPVYITRLLETACGMLGLPFRTCRSSTLSIPDALHGQERILAIAQAIKATHYVNAPGGRELYDKDVFAARGMKLSLLPAYDGNHASVLERLLQEDPRIVASEITGQCGL